MGGGEVNSLEFTPVSVQDTELQPYVSMTT